MHRYCVLLSAVGCFLPLGGTTTPSPTDLETVWVGFGPMSLTIDGETIERVVLATVGHERGDTEPPNLVIVPDKGLTSGPQIGGFRFGNASFTVPVEAGETWQEGRDWSGPADLAMLLGSPEVSRLVGEGEADCTADFTHLELLPPNILLPGLIPRRYRLQADCPNIVWEETTRSGVEGVYDRVEIDVEVYVQLR